MPRFSGAVLVVLLHLLFYLGLRAGTGSPSVPRVTTPEISYVTSLAVRRSSQREMMASLMTRSSSKQHSQHPSMTPKNEALASAHASTRQHILRTAPAPAHDSAGIRASIPDAPAAAGKPAADGALNGQAQRNSSLDYDAIGKTVKDIATENRDRDLPGSTRQISSAQQFENAVSQSARGDCATQHAQLGLLAIPLLLKDTVTGNGCKW